MDTLRAKEINATIIPESSHQINFRNIDNNAIKIVRDLQRASYESYLVGGCVRDLLLNKRPKDFDVTTGAHPEQAHKVFNRSRLIGRRFKLLHVRFGRELIEVATFRASHDNNSTENQAKQADSGMILRDNVYGTIDQDAMRRDFTINAMYYDVNSRSIYDFTDGYKDISLRLIRMIGDPSERYREDPVRMLRAIRFAAKLDFSIEPRTAEPIKELAPLLFDIAPARLFDEVLKLLQSGHGVDSLRLLREYKLLETILPQTSRALNENLENAQVLINNALINTDKRIKQRKSVSPGFLFAVLLWPSVQDQLQRAQSKKRAPPLSALHEASSQVISEQVKRTSIPKRFSTNIREIWELQLRLSHRPALKAEQLLEHPRFRAAYDLLVLREKSGEDLNGISDWWTDYQAANPEQKETLVKTLNANSNKSLKKKRPAKTFENNAAFEKFDVVEQVKPQTSSRNKRREKPKAPALESSTEAQQQATTAEQPSKKAQQQEATAEQPSREAQQQAPAAVESSKKAQQQAPVAVKSTVARPDAPILADSTQTRAAQPTAEAGPTISPSSAPKNTRAADKSTQQLLNKDLPEQPTAPTRKKVRRGRAKNDPRNK